jgi:hypothetical protein
MNGLAPYIAAGFAAALALTSLEFDASSGPGFAGSQAVMSSASSPHASATDSRKGDLLKPRPAGEQAQTVATVELVGLQNATIVFRNAGGRVLYRSDPTTAVTVVSKGVVVPQVTIREADQASPRNVPAESVQQPSMVPEGCDTGLSLLAGTFAPRTGLRCVTEREETVKVAGLFD